ncbi:MAG: hypothetical protein LH606_03415 [Cytophagaceae bacterium]|nr:hypothetical protein [Cytophagaceae bacterium]
MKTVLLLLLWFWAQQALAQPANGFIGEDSTEYLRIWEKSSSLGKPKVGVDFGQRVKWASSDEALKHPNGGIMPFNSLVDALNFLDRRGFEVITGRSFPNGGGEYLLRRKKIP